MEYINELLEELDYYWDAYDDSRTKGEHPRCIEIQEELIPIFLDWSDEKLLAFCKNISKEKLEQLAYPLEEISIAHPCVEPYVQY